MEEDKLNSDQRIMYSSLVSIRNNEVNLRWTRIQIFFIIHSAGLSLVVTQTVPGTYTHIFSCILGVFLGILWRLVVRRIGHWVNYWDERLSRFEKNQPIKIFSGVGFVRASRGITTHAILFRVVEVFIIIWTVLGLFSAYQAFTK